jgi:hypothetical protein
MLSLGTTIRVVGQGSREGLPNLDIILLIDNSRGMSQALGGDPASDPDGLRIRAAKFLVDFLKANAEATGANHRVGVVSFGGVVSDTIPLRPVDDNAVRDRIHDEVIDYTDFRPALRYALGELKSKSFNSGNKMAVVLFTDGQPWPVGAGEPTVTDTQKYFSPADQDPNHLAGLVQAIQNPEQKPEAEVFVLGIGNAQRDQANWTQPGLLPAEHFITITSATDLAEVYHRLAGDLLGLPVQPGNPISSGQKVSITVEPYLEQLIVSFMKSDPAIVITLTDPSGVPVTTTAPTGSYHLVYLIPDPASGPWMAAWTGKGEVQYWVDRYYPLVKVFLDVPYPYTGQAFTVTAGLWRDGVVVTDSSLRLEAEIVAPNAVTLTRSLESLGNGYHAGVITDALQFGGTYTVTAQALLSEVRLLSRQWHATTVIIPVPPTPTFTPRPTDKPTSSPTSTSTGIPTNTPAPGSMIETRTTEPTAASTPPPRGSILGVVSPNSNHAVELFIGGLIVLLASFFVIRLLLPRVRGAPGITSAPIGEIEALRQEAGRLIADGKLTEAEACLEEAVEKAGKASSEVMEAFTGTITGLVEDLLYRIDQTSEEQQARIVELARSPDVLVRRGLAHVLRQRRWRGNKDQVVGDIRHLLDAGGNSDVLLFAAEGDRDPLARLCQAFYALVVAEKQGIDAAAEALRAVVDALARLR